MCGAHRKERKRFAFTFWCGVVWCGELVLFYVWGLLKVIVCVADQTVLPTSLCSPSTHTCYCSKFPFITLFFRPCMLFHIYLTILSQFLIIFTSSLTLLCILSENTTTITAYFNMLISVMCLSKYCARIIYVKPSTCMPPMKEEGVGVRGCFDACRSWLFGFCNFLPTLYTLQYPPPYLLPCSCTSSSTVNMFLCRTLCSKFATCPHVTINPVHENKNQ